MVINPKIKLLIYPVLSVCIRRYLGSIILLGLFLIYQLVSAAKNG